MDIPRYANRRDRIPPQATQLACAYNEIGRHAQACVEAVRTLAATLLPAVIILSTSADGLADPHDVGVETKAIRPSERALRVHTLHASGRWF